MFCPVCKSEYRVGFTKCSDCGVDLVELLPGSSNTSPSGLISDPDATEILWAGQNATTRTEICSRLDALGIAFEDDAVDSKLMPAFPQSIYRIQIRKQDHEAAVEVLRGLAVDDFNVWKSPGVLLDRNSELTNVEAIKRDLLGRLIGHRPDSPGSDSGDAATQDADTYDASQDSVSDVKVEDFNSNDATSEVWSGDDEQMAQTFKDCLREVGIGCVIAAAARKQVIFVLPSFAARAKEIIREIVDQTPPE